MIEKCISIYFPNKILPFNKFLNKILCNLGLEKANLFKMLHITDFSLTFRNEFAKLPGLKIEAYMIRIVTFPTGLQIDTPTRVVYEIVSMIMHRLSALLQRAMNS